MMMVPASPAAAEPELGAFDDALTWSAEVLAALPSWRETRRPIAVAIVDQKMPGMTGIDLCELIAANRPDIS